MQDLVGIVRTESEMQQALEVIEQLRTRADRGGHRGPSPIQQRLAHRHGSAETC